MDSMENIDPFEEYVGPAWLQKIQGSLSEERRKSRPRTYRAIIRKCRSLNSRYSFCLSELLQKPDLLNIRLSEYAAESSKSYYNLEETMDLRITGFEKEILGKKQYKKIQNLLWYLIFTDYGYIEFLLDEKIEKILRNFQFENRTWSETYELFKLKQSLGKIQLRQFLEDIFYSSTVKDRISAGKNLFLKLHLSFFNVSEVKRSIRKRGYSDKGTLKPKHQKERERSMKEIAREIEEQRNRILKKQLDIFERNLDRILEIETLQTKEEKQQSFFENRKTFQEKLENTIPKEEESDEQQRTSTVNSEK